MGITLTNFMTPGAIPSCIDLFINILIGIIIQESTALSNFEFVLCSERFLPLVVLRIVNISYESVGSKHIEFTFGYAFN